jgi:hypothetical protein
MLSEIGVHSLIDVGCGRGISTSYFYRRGVDVLCVEGSHDAIQQSYLPRERIVQHDFSGGQWWPEQTYDVAWSTEFLEHVGRQYMDNYITVFMKAALVFVTTSGWGGHHHVEVHAPWWWKARFEARGFIYSEYLSSMAHDLVQVDKERFKQGNQLVGLLVFINPRVASLPRHKHLLAGHGCYDRAVDNENGGAACTGSDALPDEYKTLISCQRLRPAGSTELYKKYPWVCPTRS